MAHAAAPLGPFTVECGLSRISQLKHHAPYHHRYIKFTVSDEELSEVQRLSSRVLIVVAAASSSYKLFALQFHCALITDSRNFRLVKVAKTAQQASVSRP